MAAALEASAIRDARELQSSCDDILRSGSVEQVSYLFDPPSVLSSLANLDREALDLMESALARADYSSGRSASPAAAAAVSSSTTRPSSSGPTRSSRRLSAARTALSSTVDVSMAPPPVSTLFDTPSSPAVPAEDGAPEEDELAMSGVEGSVVNDKGKGVAEDSS